jgi:hypothetical protein
MIYPRCLNFRQQSVAINYQGFIVPCCLLMSPAGFEELKSLLGDKINQLHYTKGSIEHILQSEAAEIVRKSFNENPMKKCQDCCKEPFNNLTTPAGGKVFKIRSSY